MKNSKAGRKILFVRLGKIGDIIIASSAFRAWKSSFPDDAISLITLSSNREVLKYNPDIDKIYFVNRNVLLYFQLINLMTRKFDLLIDLNDDSSTTSRVIRKMLNFQKSAGFKFDNSSGIDIAVTRPEKNKTHIIDRLKILLCAVEPRLESVRFHTILYIGEKENSEVVNQINSIKSSRKIIAINLSAGAPIRYWPSENWIELISRISSHSDSWNFILLADKKDLQLQKNISSKIKSDIFVLQIFNSFQHYAAYIKHSDLLITADTSAVHIASSFNLPVVSLFPNYEWNFVSWQPLSKNCKSIRSDENNISAIKVETVYNSFLNLVSELNR